MSVSLQIIVKHTPINLQNKEEVSAIIIDTFEKCKEYCRENGYNEEEFYTRNQTYKYVKLLEESECWICDEYHLANTPTKSVLF